MIDTQVMPSREERLEYLRRYDAARREPRRDYKRDYMRQHRVAKKAGLDTSKKPAGDWADPEYVRQYHLEYDRLHRGKRKAQAHERYIKNREAFNAQAVQWRKDHPERYREYQENYRKEHPEKAKERLRRWRAAHPELRRASWVDSIDEETREYVAILLSDPCSYCNGQSGTIDHVDPLSRNGANHWDNMTSACGNCNQRKSTKALVSFLIYRRTA